MKVLFAYPEVGAGVRWTELLHVGVLAASLRQSSRARSELLYFKHPSQLPSVEKILPRIKPDVIVAHLGWDQWKSGAPLLREMRRAAPTVPIIAAGVYPTLDPDSVAEDAAVDVLIVGENDLALNDLVRCQISGKAMENLPNLWIKNKDGGLIKNPQRPLMENLDTLPFPDRTLYDHEALVQASGGGAPVLAGRGCPYGCQFCHMPRLKRIASGKGTFVRARSPMAIIAEVKDLSQRFPIQWVNFVDDYFPQDVSWLSQFCAQWKTQVRLPFRFTGVAELLNPQSLRLLEMAGCAGIRLGVETGNEKFRSRIAERNLSNERLLALAEEARSLGIEIQTHNMVGLPLESVELARETVAFNRQLKPASVKTAIFNPIPGTQLHAFCREKDYLRGDTVGDFNPRQTRLELPAISREEIFETYDALQALNLRLQVERVEPAPGVYCDLIALSDQAAVECAMQPAMDIDMFAVDGDARLCLMQALGSRIEIPVELHGGGMFRFALALGPSPYGLRHLRPAQAEASLLLPGGETEILFGKALDPKATRKGWQEYQVPLPSVGASAARLILTASMMGGAPAAPLFVAWARPALAEQWGAGHGHASTSGAARTPVPAANIAADVDHLKKENQELRDRIDELNADLDLRKARIGELRVREIELEKELQQLREEKIEWMRLKAEMEQSMGGKLKKLFKKP